MSLHKLRSASFWMQLRRWNSAITELMYCGSSSKFQHHRVLHFFLLSLSPNLTNKPPTWNLPLAHSFTMFSNSCLLKAVGESSLVRAWGIFGGMSRCHGNQGEIWGDSEWSSGSRWSGDQSEAELVNVVCCWKGRKFCCLCITSCFQTTFVGKLIHFPHFFLYFLSKSMWAFGGENAGFKLEPADKSALELWGNFTAKMLTTEALLFGRVMWNCSGGPWSSILRIYRTEQAILRLLSSKTK